VVRTPRSVYAAIPGRNKYRPSQTTPIKNFFLAGDWSSQKFLGSMEGAVLAGKLAAQSIIESVLLLEPSIPIKAVDNAIKEAAINMKPREPLGIGNGDGAFAFGGGEILPNSFKMKGAN
jgi:15-cis-phytoene desaturase